MGSNGGDGGGGPVITCDVVIFSRLIWFVSSSNSTSFPFLLIKQLKIKTINVKINHSYRWFDV